MASSMPPNHAARVAELFFDRPPVAANRALYGIFDGARDPSVHLAITDSGLKSMCLFRGVDARLAANSPWLVRLERTDLASRELVQEAWGHSWGVFCESIADLEVLGRHLRGFLRVRDPEGRTLLFRYYDPRVLRVFLPTVTADEAKRFSGPVLRFLVESEHGDAVLEHTASAEGMACRVLSLDPASLAAAPSPAPTTAIR